MASQTFTRKTSRAIGTANTAIGAYTPGAGNTAIIIGCSVCNVSNGQSIAVTVAHYDGANYTNLAYQIPLLPGATLVVIGGDEKLVMIPTDNLIVSSNLASSVDAIMSLLEMAP